MDVVWGALIGIFITVSILSAWSWRRGRAREKAIREEWEEHERQKCLESPYYFYITYWEVNGKNPDPKMSENDFNDLFHKLSKKIITKTEK